MRRAERWAISHGALIAVVASLATEAFGQDTRSGEAGSSWFPSQYGAGDLIGAANNLSPAGVLAATKLVKTGQVYALGQAVDTQSDRGQRTYGVVVIQPGNGDGKPLFDNKLTVNDDLVIAWQGLGTRIDGFAHVGIDHLHYNGLPAGDFVRRDGILKFSVDQIPPIVTRGVMLDIAALKGVEFLQPGVEITVEDIQAAEKREKLSLAKGDVVLIHTGWQQHHSHDIKRGLDEPGVGLAGARYLAGKGVVAVGADTEAFEVVPAKSKGDFMPVHQQLLDKSGVYIIQDVATQQLADDQAYSFMFVLGQPRLVGAVTAIVNPIAIR
jgi:kynurenine formamidase